MFPDVKYIVCERVGEKVVFRGTSTPYLSFDFVDPPFAPGLNVPVPDGHGQVLGPRGADGCPAERRLCRSQQGSPKSRRRRGNFTL